MHVRVIVAAAALAACALGAQAQESVFRRDHGKVAEPPVAQSPSLAGAPPEGVAAGGLDFGAWRGTDPTAYGAAMRARIGARIDGKPLAQARADLEANGFTCVEARERGPSAPALECRIAIVERGCAIEWWAVREDAGAAVLAGHDVMCARR